MPRTNQKLHIATFLVAALLGGGCGESYEEKQAKENAAREALESDVQAKLDARTKAFRVKYGITQSWKDQLKAEKQPSTYLLQKALIRSDSAPLLFVGSVLDVEKKGEGFSLLFYVPGFEQGLTSEEHLVLRLVCPSLTEEDIIKLTPKEFYAWDDHQDYLIAANISAVTQSRQFLETSSRERDSSTLTKLRTEYIAEGRCKGLENIQDIRQEYHDKVSAITSKRDFIKHK